MTDTREVAEGLLYQGEDEDIIYTIDVSAIGDTPSSPVLVVKDEDDGFSDVTATMVPAGSASVSDNIITLPSINSLTREVIYRCEVAFTLGGNDLEHYFRIMGER